MPLSPRSERTNLLFEIAERARHWLTLWSEQRTGHAIVFERILGELYYEATCAAYARLADLCESHLKDATVLYGNPVFDRTTIAAWVARLTTSSTHSEIMPAMAVVENLERLRCFLTMLENERRDGHDTINPLAVLYGPEPEAGEELRLSDDVAGDRAHR